MTGRPLTGLTLVLALAFPLAAGAAPETTPPPGGQERTKDHRAKQEMEHRGDQGMGFSQAKTTHHFLLKADGGVIEVTANDPADTTSRDRIRMHLAHIARAFAEGKFDIPMFVHDQTPSGVPVMVAKKDRIQYRFESVEKGGRVAMTTDDPEALAAIHDFLRFQIREHETGDPTTVEKSLEGR